MPSFSFSYEYDGAGNRTKKINNLTSEVTTYVYDSANQLISMEGPDGITTFDWDAAGNMIAKHAPEGTTTYTWDYRNRLTQVAPPVGDPINFAYNAMGQRIQKNGTRFIYDGVQMLQETDLNNQTLRSNTFTNEGYGDLVSESDGTDSSFPTFNGQWSTDAIVDKTATVTDRISYSAFGGEDSHTGASTTPFRFVGKQSYYCDAETGLYLLGAGGNPNGAGRYYDPELGRFISRDPIGLAGGDVNLYRYAGNNSVKHVDPSGLKCQCVVDIIKVDTRYRAVGLIDTNQWANFTIQTNPSSFSFGPMDRVLCDKLVRTRVSYLCSDQCPKTGEISKSFGLETYYDHTVAEAPFPAGAVSIKTSVSVSSIGGGGLPVQVISRITTFLGYTFAAAFDPGNPHDIDLGNTACRNAENTGQYIPAPVTSTVYNFFIEIPFSGTKPSSTTIKKCDELYY